MDTQATAQVTTQDPAKTTVQASAPTANPSASPSETLRPQAVQDWVHSVARRTGAERIHWCDGSEAERNFLIAECLKEGELLALDAQRYPNCYLHRSHPSDVARVEHLTFICTPNEEDAGPNNHWREPQAAHRQIDAIFEGAMRGRTMYVIPYVMGPIDSPYAQCGVEISDSRYVVLNMGLMTRMGTPALERIARGEPFVKGLHALADLSPERRFIMHFPQENLIKSVGSGYGGNALLGKKCHALRIASHRARQEGWLAEHMLIVGIENPQGEKHYVAAAFPSACGKTNLAMLIPPESHRGWKIHTVGDDIAWMHFDKTGRLRAINPEAGYFGVVPGTSAKTNKNALDMLNRNCIFTNVGLTPEKTPWWEGLSSQPPANLTDWKGNPLRQGQKAAHPNARFTVSAHQNPCYAEEAEDPEGVPISAIVFGGRRPSLLPLVFEAFDWAHGVFLGASVASETTAAATGQTGIIRRDPMAMKPFCGYNFADYWQHWLSFAAPTNGTSARQLPKIFHVNWFRQDDRGRFLWPGFGENLRVLRWILDRCQARADAERTPIGYLPAAGAIDTQGLDITPQTMAQLTAIDRQGWHQELDAVREYLAGYGERLPTALIEQHDRVRAAL